MDMHTGKITHKSSRISGAQRSHDALLADVSHASNGDVRAAGRLLSDLSGEDRRLQSRAAAAILASAGTGFWMNMLEFAAIGTWSGGAVALPASIERRNLLPKLAGLFLARQDESSATARREALASGLSSPEPGVRRFVVDLLRSWGGALDQAGLVSLLNDSDAGVRLRAARTLGKVGDGRAVLALIEALGYSDDLIAGEAADALARIGEPALEPLTAALRDEDPYVRWHAAKALAEMANLRAADALLAALDDQNFGVRWYASNGLAAMGTRVLVPLLRTLRTHKLTPWLAEAAIHILKNIKDAKTVMLVEELEKMLGDSYANVEAPIEADRLLKKLEEAYRHEAGSV
ncbi:MAG: HEAT repeat domain-containing protein [Dehalococcoidia bacterium]|nr:HEAT repeat domain-containing protein [Dehalococcoidia bacterium]